VVQNIASSGAPRRSDATGRTPHYAVTDAEIRKSHLWLLYIVYWKRSSAARGLPCKKNRTLCEAAV